MKFSIKDIFSKCDETCSLPRIWSHLLKKSLMENFIYCAVQFHYLKKLFEQILKQKIVFCVSINLDLIDIDCACFI